MHGYLYPALRRRCYNRRPMSPISVSRYPADYLIVALDFDSAHQADTLVGLLGESVGFYKVGWQLFLGAGWLVVDSLLARGKRVFLDLKIGDIDETVRAAVSNMPASAGSIELMTISGSGATVRAAKEGRKGDRPKILMLTALSSWNDDDVRDFLSDERASLAEYISRKAERALDAGVEGLVASGESVRTLRDRFGARSFLIVTPGVRPSGSRHDDHKRTLTPGQAIRDGADYLVVGRPITRAADPQAAAQAIVEEIGAAL